MFDLDEEEFLNFRPHKKELLLAHLNFAMINYNPEENFFLSDIFKEAKCCYGQLNSFDCKRKKKRKNRYFKKKLKIKLKKKKGFINQNHIINFNRKKRLKEIKYLIKKKSLKKLFQKYRRKGYMVEPLSNIYEDESVFADDFWEEELHAYIFESSLFYLSYLSEQFLSFEYNQFTDHDFFKELLYFYNFVNLFLNYFHEEDVESVALAYLSIFNDLFFSQIFSYFFFDFSDEKNEDEEDDDEVDNEYDYDEYDEYEDNEEEENDEDEYDEYDDDFLELETDDEFETDPTFQMDDESNTKAYSKETLEVRKMRIDIEEENDRNNNFPTIDIEEENDKSNISSIDI